MKEEDFLFGRGDRDLNARKEVKVKLPIAQLIKLHGLKLVKGQTITDTVVEALDRYFEERILDRAHGGPKETEETATVAALEDR